MTSIVSFILHQMVANSEVGLSPSLRLMTLRVPRWLPVVMVDLYHRQPFSSLTMLN